MANPLCIRLTWQPYFDATLKEYNNNDWIFEVQWRRSDNENTRMIAGKGLYIIVDNAGREVYAGETTKVRERFDGRTEALREFRLSRPPQWPPNNPVNGYTVHVATVNPSAKLRLAEKWLVRTLYTQHSDDI